jgi:ABC-2 family transporter protein
MIPALFWTTVREKLTRPLFIVLISLLILAHVAVTLRGPDPALANPAGLLAAIIAAGSVGRDVSSGALALIFTRPLKRSSYIFTKWLAVSLAATAVTWLCLFVEEILLWQQGHGSLGELAREVARGTTLCFGLSSVLLLFSSLVPGYGDVAIWAGVALANVFVSTVAGVRVATEIGDTLAPGIDWVGTFGGGHVSWSALCSYASTLLLCLGLAIAAINRKELSYASG